MQIAISQVKPFRDKVLVLPDQPPSMTASGIALPDAWTVPPGTGTVIAVGPGRWNNRSAFMPTTLKSGDRVSFRWIDGEQEQKKWRHNDKTYVFFHENEIFLVQEEV